MDFAQDFFGREAFLTVSEQLNIEAYCRALTKVYTLGPTFRAENSNTSRHLAEFWMVEPEIAFADLSDNAALAEALLKYTFAALLKEREDLTFFDQRIAKGHIAKLEGIVGSEFVHMDYGEAIQVLERAGERDFEFPVKWGVDLQSEHERYLTEKYEKKPVIVMNYPKDIKASCTTPGTAVCAATARCRMPASASSTPSPMSSASPTTAAPSQRWTYWRRGSARSSAAASARLAVAAALGQTQ